MHIKYFHLLVFSLSFSEALSASQVGFPKHSDNMFLTVQPLQVLSWLSTARPADALVFALKQGVMAPIYFTFQKYFF